MEFSLSAYIDKAKLLLFKPKEFWKAEKENANDSKVGLVQLLPLLLVLFIAVFAGEFFRRSDFFFEFPLLKALREMLLFVLQYFIGVFFTKELMKTFGGEKDIETARKLVVYSMLPLLLISVVTGLVPYVTDLNILGAYGCYLFWMGAKELVVLADEKLDKYIMITIVFNFFVFLFISVFLSKLLNAYFYGT